MANGRKISGDTASYLILAVSTIALSFAGPLVKKCEEALPFALGFIRLGLGSLLVMPFGRPWEAVKHWRSMGWAALSGFCFFLHLTAWFICLRLVSIAIATTMLALLPVVVMLLEFVFQGKKPLAIQLLGIGISVAGTILIVFNNLGQPSQLLGILLMVGALIAGGFYLFFSMKAQEKLTSWQTVSIIYPSTCLSFGVMVLITGQPITDLTANTYWWILSLAIIPTFFGHALLNMSCKRLSPVVATTATLAEPFIASIVAWFWFGQSISVLAAIGAIIVLVGIFITLKNSRKLPQVDTSC